MGTALNWRGTVEERFARRCAPIDSDGHIMWLGGKTGNGYGQLYVAGNRVPAHRFAYEQAHGPIAAGLDVDHLCRVKRCVNPAHLEAVTHAENIRRGRNGELIRARAAAQTHCKRGHEFTAENTRRKGNKRICIACARAYDREWKRAKKLSERVPA